MHALDAVYQEIIIIMVQFKVAMISKNLLKCLYVCAPCIPVLLLL